MLALIPIVGPIAAATVWFLAGLGSVVFVSPPLHPLALAITLTLLF
jgi:hypothetical protein